MTLIRLAPSNFQTELLVKRNRRLLLLPCPIISGFSSLPEGILIHSEVSGVGWSVFHRIDSLPLRSSNQISSLSATFKVVGVKEMRLFFLSTEIIEREFTFLASVPAP